MVRRRLVWLLAIAPLAVPMIALAVASLTASPSSLVFGSRCVRTTASPKGVTVTNDGNPEATDVTVSVSPSASGKVFPLNGETAVPTVAPDESFSFSVGFAPQRGGVASADAVIAYQGTEPSSSATPSPSPQAKATTVPLTGTALDRFVSVSPPSLNFGSVRLGRAAGNRTVAVYDDGSTSLRVSSIRLTGPDARDFSVSPAGAHTLERGDPLVLSVGFEPRELGGRAADLVIETNACEEPTVVVPLGGAGVEPDVGVRPPSIDVGRAVVGRRAKTLAVQVVNQGGWPLKVTSIRIRDARPVEFDLRRKPDLPRALRPGAAIELVVRFRAEEIGFHTATLRVRSTDPDAPTFDATITGEGLEAPEPSPTLSPAAAPPPPPPGPDRGFRFPVGEHVPEIAVGASVIGFFVALALIRRARGIPE